MRKAQFGPDALVGMVVVAVIGLGGVFFLNTFVSGLTVESIISILDQEIDQRCFFMILPLTGDEYIRAGESTKGYSDSFEDMYDYFGGDRIYANQSYEFNQTLTFYSIKLKNTPLGQKPTYMVGFIAPKDVASDLREKAMGYFKEKGLTIKQYCFVPVYNPIGDIGTAEVLIAEDAECSGGICTQ